MAFGTAIATCFSKFVTFAGRARRSEYWKFNLFFIICVIGGLILDLAFGTIITDENDEFAGGAVFWLIFLVFVLPLISAAVRRLHDIDRSGWWYWIQLIPFAGPIIMLVWMCTEGTSGSNRFGDDGDMAAVFE